MMIDRHENSSGTDDRTPGRIESKQFLPAQKPEIFQSEIYRPEGESSRRTRRAIRRLLVKFNAARRDAENILRKLNEISQRIASGRQQGPSA